LLRDAGNILASFYQLHVVSKQARKGRQNNSGFSSEMAMIILIPG
jgi:hypothetical protein